MIPSPGCKCPVCRQRNLILARTQAEQFLLLKGNIHVPSQTNSISIPPRNPNERS